ncbi:MAG: response regulator transcription factor [Spirochaetaceae bacterium]|nr:response regulator transcription factor [Spirochaetaceae bacterium]
MMNNRKIRVLLADDQPLFIHSLARVMENRAEDIDIIGIVENGSQAVDFVNGNKPDIILMDIKMPVMNGVEAVRIIADAHPDIKIMMLTTFDEDEFVFEALKFGAKGYLLKNILPDEVITATRALYAGIDQVSPEIITRLTSKLNRSGGDLRDLGVNDRKVPQWFVELTRLEREIIKHVVVGMTNKEIAFTLNLAEQTVKNYLSNIYGKMDVHKRSQVIKKYVEDGVQDFN